MMRLLKLQGVFSVGLAAAAAASIASATTIRGGADDGEAVGSAWPFHHGTSDIKDGITFERTETSYSPLSDKVTASWWQLLLGGSSHFVASLLPARFQTRSTPQLASPRATFDDGHCESSDAYGGNICHYDWDDDITINYDGRLGQQQLDVDVYVEMSVTIDKLVRHSQTCPICGDDPCTISGVPSVPKLNWSVELPPCPLSNDSLFGEWKTKLPGKNPVPRMLGGIGGGTVVEGTVMVKRRNNGHDDDDDVLMEVKGIVHLK